MGEGRLSAIPEPGSAGLRGSQAVGRAVQLLRIIARRPVEGWSLADLTVLSALEDATVRRLLKRLVHEQLVARRARDGHYVPGPLLYELGLATFPHAVFQSRCEPLLARLSGHFRSAAYLYLRSGCDFVCIGLRNPLAIGSIALPVGVRRSLGLAAGGVAMLLALGSRERQSVLAYCEQDAASRGARATRTFRGIMARSGPYGIGVNLGDGLPGVAAVAAAICAGPGQPVAALGISNRVEPMLAVGIDQLVETVQAEARGIESTHREMLEEMHSLSASSGG